MLCAVDYILNLLCAFNCLQPIKKFVFSVASRATGRLRIKPSGSGEQNGFIRKLICTQVTLNYTNILNCSLCEPFIKEPCRAIFYLFKKLWYLCSYQLNSKINVTVLLFKSKFRHWNCFSCRLLLCYGWQELTWIWNGSRLMLYMSICRPRSTFFDFQSLEKNIQLRHTELLPHSG